MRNESMIHNALEIASFVFLASSQDYDPNHNSVYEFLITIFESNLDDKENWSINQNHLLRKPP